MAKSTVSREDFIRLTVANTIGEYLKPYQCDPAKIKKAHARCIHDANMIADELFGSVTEMVEDRLLETGNSGLSLVK